MSPVLHSQASEPAVETRFLGVMRRGRGWRLTGRGWALVALVFLAGLLGFLLGIHPFLAVQAPVRADVLVVEGWAADYAIKAAAREFEQGGYATVYVTGGPMERGAPLSEYRTYAALGAAVLDYFGAPTNHTQAVPAPKVRRDRTYASALALRDWMEAQDESPTALNVLTIGPHARRSRLLYEKAFAGTCRIGVIPIEPQEYDPDRWWAYSAGVRTVMSETVAYFYARVFFRFSSDRRPENKSGAGSGEPTP
ncbi:MAG: YdcF family protein [Verrucomicrobia bacterium]|jgi:hypothetical protein|nr:YdcF family protein [Verrucomicrobiota bacterium]